MRTIDLEELKHLKAFTDRVKRRKEEYVKAKPKLMPERSHLFTESWKQTEGDPLSLRYSKAYRSVLEGIPVVIRDGELIVGSLTEEIRGSYATPEWSADMFLKQLREKEITSDGPNVRCNIDEAARQSILEDASYWKGKSVVDQILNSCRQLLGYQLTNLVEEWSEDTIWHPIWQSQTPARGMNWPEMLEKGLNGIIAEIRQEMDRLKNFSAEEIQKFHFMQASINSCEAVIDFVKRYTSLARVMAVKEINKQRKKELEEIAEILEHVPAEPARNFREALQSCWIGLIACELEACAVAPCLGRWDQYLYPFYVRDITKRRITNDEVAELISLILVKFNELEAFRDKKVQEAHQNTYLSNIIIGGQTASGKDGVNDLSYIILEAARQTKMPQPHISVRYHDGIEPDFLIKAVETNRDHGAGIPAFFNDNVALLRLVSKGCPISEAREKFIIIGCVEAMMFMEGHVPRVFFFNLPKVLEFTLYNGVDPRTGKKWTIATGDPTQFTSYEQFHQAFKKQLAYVIDLVCKVSNVGTVVRGESIRYPLWSTFMKDCVKKGVDWTQGGQRWPDLFEAINPYGAQNTANSLAAIKKVVFEDKVLSMRELLDALACNFEGKENVRHLLLSAPKFGNDDDYVDNIMVDLFNLTQEYANNHVGPFWKEPMNVSRQGLTFHFSYGKVVGALPDGRKAWETLADGSVSPMRGTDVKGPTAVFKSASKVDHVPPESTLLNMKLSPALLRDKTGILKFIQCLKTYFDLGGYHAQFNVIDQKTLEDAKKHPEEHRDLLVRVAGYSAYFVQLAPDVQDEIICRTAHERL